MLDMLGPWIDERHVLARLHHMGAGIPADGTRSDNRYFPAHAFLPVLLAAEANVPAEPIIGPWTTTAIRSGHHQPVAGTSSQG
jgi:hypothetical protein